MRFYQATECISWPRILLFSLALLSVAGAIAQYAPGYLAIAYLLLAAAVWSIRYRKYLLNTDSRFPLQGPALRLIFVPLAAYCFLATMATYEFFEQLALWFDQFLAQSLPGPARTGRKLLADGYQEPAIQFKAHVLVMFLTVAWFGVEFVFAYLSSLGRVDYSKKDIDETLKSSRSGSAVFVFAFLLPPIFYDFYTTCYGGRCNGLVHGSVYYHLLMINLMVSFSWIALGLGIASVFALKVLQLKEADAAIE